MGEDYDQIPIPGVERVRPVRRHDDGAPQQKQQSQQDDDDESPPEHGPEEAIDHFDALAAAAEEAHQHLVEEGSPYRFCVYREEGEVFIDIVRLDKAGQVDSSIRKNITHQEFDRWVNAILTGEGIFFEGTA